MITLKAYAKINLGLRILRKQEDGYHDIETLLHRIDLLDEICLEPAPTISLTCQKPDLPTDGRNLCVRAAQILQQEVKIKAGVHITLKKKIPIGAGLGGGSSDAASTLLGLIKLWLLDLPHATLHSLALQLGSDVPYFLSLGTAYATGRGEKLECFHLNIPYWIVLVYPNLRISTRWAYQNIQISNLKSQISIKQLLLENLNNPRRLITLLPNDFESLVLRTHEPVARVKQALYVAGAEFAQMSGSGSAVYGFFSNERYAREAAEELRKHYPVFITRPHFQPEP